MPISACNNYLITIPGTGYNKVNVPGPDSKGYTSITDQLLYEIWQTLLIIAGSTGTPVAKAIIFTIGDGQAGTPLAGTTSLHAAMLQGQSIVDKQLLIIRNSVPLRYYDGINHYEIIRFNNPGVSGGFDLDPASGITFQDGDDYQIYIVGVNETAAP